MNDTEIPDGFDPGFWEPKKPRRGRPQLLEDQVLVGKCQSLLGVFEYFWSDVAWHLPRATSLPKVRAALRTIEDKEHGILELFLHEAIRSGKKEELSRVRSELKKAELQLRSVLNELPEVQERYNRARRAIEQFPEDDRIRSLLARHESSYRYAEKLQQKLSSRVENLRDELKSRSARFAQSELLEFIRCKRYTFTPVNLSKAMAGLPELTWRQSAARLSKLEVSHPYEAEYKMFELVRKAIGKSVPRKSAKAEARAKSFLEKNRNRDYVTSQLKKNWHFLLTGIENAYAARVPMSAIPYTAFSEYRRISMSPSSADVLIAEETAL